MVSSVYWEWELLLLTVKLGIKLAFIYDGIRVFRFFVSHRNIIISIEDLLFWIYAGIIIFELQLEQSNGVLRGFSILGMLLGMFLYSKLLGERLLFVAEKGSVVFKRQLTEFGKVFKMNLGRQKSVSKNVRRKHGRKKEKKEDEKANPSGSDYGHDDSNCDACGGCGE